MQILMQPMGRTLRPGMRVSGGLTTIFQLATLDLRFAQQKTLDPRITFTRASSGTYVGSDGVLRSATTNVIWPSEDFTTSWGLAAATRVADAGVAPNGTLTADRIESTGGGVFRSGVSVASGVSYTYSVYIKHVSGTGVISTIGFERFGSVPLAGSTSFNVLTGTVVSNGASVTASSITPVGDGWYRVSVRATSTDTTTTITNYAAASGNQFLLWGAQLEQSSTVGEYIPTTSVINSAPRFDHNPTTGESLGLLVEEQRTNLLTFSEQFDNAAWTKANLLAFGSGSTANAIAAPDGTITADLLTENTSAGQHRVYRTASSTTNTNPYTVSFFAKAGTRSRVYVGIAEGSTFSRQGNATFNLSTGTVANFSSGSSGATGGSATITALPDNWYRCSYTLTLGGTDTSVFTDINIDNGSTINYTGNGTGGIYIWGAQLEAGAFPTSYIPTTTATVTRSADVASITGTNFSSWYRQDEGTIFTDSSNRGTYPGSNTFPYLLQIDDETNTNRINLDNSILGSGFRYNVAVVNNGTSLEFSQAGFASGTARWATGLKSSDSAFAINLLPNTITSQNTAILPAVMKRMRIGIGFGQQFTGTIRRLAYWPQRLPNSTLQEVTR